MPGIFVVGHFHQAYRNAGFHAGYFVGGGGEDPS